MIPFRWDLVTPDQLGSLRNGTAEPTLWHLADLVACTGKVLARSGDADLVFVGRSLDSMYDLLGGAMTSDRLSRLPLSFARPYAGSRRRPLTPAELSEARRILASLSLTPHALSRRARPVAFVDVVHEGATFTELFELLRRWIDEDREPWPVIRRKLRFIGVTTERRTSPKTYRWQQHAPWTRQLPARSVRNVSLHPFVWSYFGDHQTKLTRSYHPDRWLADDPGPSRDDATRQALAEAAALVAYGRSPAGRRALARSMGREPALSQSWLRTMVTTLNNGAAAG
ncbi:hypothetical protein [Asanoa sp. NPDC050611]|uniref:hypothetical protein n=1 Tax=Asanoa sp. NPDC050611 TaxID=3157098 RepID=UPI0033DDD0C7